MITIVHDLGRFMPLESGWLGLVWEGADRDRGQPPREPGGFPADGQLGLHSCLVLLRTQAASQEQQWVKGLVPAFVAS